MIVQQSQKAVKEAVALLAEGKLVVLPTETVYGLAADAANGEAVAGIFAAKGRPHFNPLIAHVANRAMAENYVEIDRVSARLIEAFWPGPLTLVLPLKQGAAIHPLVSAGLPTLAIRNPKGVFADIVSLLGRAIVAPSANRSGRLSPTSAQSVADDLEGRVSFILDAGACPVGVESTIVKIDADKAFLLRPGGLATEEIEKFLGQKLIRLDQRAAIEAPGMMRSHYAPQARVRINAQDVRENEALLAFGAERIAHAERAKATLNLSPGGDMQEAAANLFDFMKKLDLADVQAIAVEPIPSHGLGEAINDRLVRAAAPRD